MKFLHSVHIQANFVDFDLQVWTVPNTCQQSILESTIWEISYLGSPSIITEAVAGCVLLEKELDVVDFHRDL